MHHQMSVDLNTLGWKTSKKETAKFLNAELKKMILLYNRNQIYSRRLEGFQKLMEESNIQDKHWSCVYCQCTLIRTTWTWNQNLSEAFKQIADEILPQLRRSHCNWWLITGKSDAEIAKYAKEDISKLDVEELLYAATLTNDLNEKAAIYQKAIDAYPSDIRTYNNLGVVKYQQGQIDEAASLFAKALGKDAKNPDANYNAGLCALAKGDNDKAIEYLVRLPVLPKLEERHRNLLCCYRWLCQSKIFFQELTPW